MTIRMRVLLVMHRGGNSPNRGKNAWTALSWFRVSVGGVGDKAYDSDPLDEELAEVGVDRPA